MKIGKLTVYASFVISLLTACGPGQEENDPQPDYLQIVTRYADAMLEHGRDRYAKESPLFATTLDRQTLALFSGEDLEKIKNISRDEWGIRNGDRAITGGNPHHHQNLYQILYALTEITKDERYAGEADEALTWFFNHCQSPATGLLTWGEHIGWDFYTDTVILHTRRGELVIGPHEFYRPWVLWDRSIQLAPEACDRFARGLWEHQISDHETGTFSRHAKWDRHGPGKNSQYPRHGGFYITTWAEAYTRTQDPVFLQAIQTVLNFFETHSSPETGAIPAEVGHPRSQGKMMWPYSNISLAVDLWDASQKVPDTLAAKMRNRAIRTDKIFTSMKHQLGPDGEGFITQSNVHTLEAVDVRDMGKRLTSHIWATGYGENTDAVIANICYLRYQQVPDKKYRDLILAAAKRYLSSEPNIDFPVYPGTLGDVIFLMLNSWEISGDQVYRERAEHFAAKAVEMFLPDGSPLPAASSKHHHYEAITRADTLMMALLKLYLLQSQSDLDVSLIWIDR